MDLECAICLEKLSLHESTNDPKNKEQKETVTTPCHHTYHKACFEKWLSVSNTCPHCRTVLYEAVPVPIILPPFDGELQLQWVVREQSGMSNMTRDTREYDLIMRQHEQDQMQNKVMTVLSYALCLIGSAYCLGDCSGMAGSWILG